MLLPCPGNYRKVWESNLLLPGLCTAYFEFRLAPLPMQHPMCIRKWEYCVMSAKVFPSGLFIFLADLLDLLDNNNAVCVCA